MEVISVEDVRRKSFHALAKRLMQEEDELRHVRAFLQNYRVLDFVLAPRTKAEEHRTASALALATVLPQTGARTTLQRMLTFLREWLDKHQVAFKRSELLQLFRVIQERVGSDVANEFKLLYVRMRGRQRARKRAKPKLGSPRQVEEALTAFERAMKVPSFGSAISSAFPAVDMDSLLTGRGKTQLAQDFELLQLPAATLAAQLTTFEFNIFRQITADEFLNQRWKKDSKSTVAPNVTAMIEQFNRVGYWVATEIVQAKCLKEQLKIVKKFIQVAAECLALSNFNSFMEILSGLNNSSVQRLKNLWENLSTKYETKFSELEAMMGTKQNFRQYRQELNSRPLPAFPYFGLYLRDFTFIYDGNQTYLADHSINFDLISLLYERTQDITRYQSLNYSIVEDERIQQKLLALSIYDSHNEDDLYMLSLKAEPSLWTSMKKLGHTPISDITPSFNETESESNNTHSDDDTDSYSQPLPSPSSSSYSPLSIPLAIPINVPLPPPLAAAQGTLHSSSSDPSLASSPSLSTTTVPAISLTKAKPTATPNTSNNNSPLQGRRPPNSPRSTSMPPAVRTTKEEIRRTQGRQSSDLDEHPSRCDSQDSLDSEADSDSQPITSSRVRSGSGIRDNEKRTRADREREREKRERRASVGRMEEALPVGEERRSSTASPRDAGTTTSPRGAAPSSLSRESRERGGDRNREKDKAERDRDREARDRDRERDREPSSRDKERRQSSERRSHKADEKKSSRRHSRRHKDGHDAPRCQGPEELMDQMAKAETLVDRYFAQCYQSAKKGTIEVCGERYLLFRASALSAEFFQVVKDKFADKGKDFAFQFLFDFGHALGKSDAVNLQKKSSCPNGVDTMLAGPIYFSYTGWAFIEILQARPEAGDSFFLYSDHICSFEADSWMSTKSNSILESMPKGPVCILGAGYSSGWVSSCFHFPSELLAVELLCKAKGDERCLFVLATENKIHDHIARFFAENKHLAQGHREALYIPQFLSTTQTYLPAVPRSLTAGTAATKLRRKLSIKGKSTLLSGEPANPKKQQLSVSSDSLGFAAQDEEARSRIGLSPDQLKQLRSVQHKVGREFSKLFQEISCDPTRGEVRLNNERHIFVRGSSISLEFVDLVEKALEEQRGAEATTAKRRSSSGGGLKPGSGIDEAERERDEQRERDELRRAAETFATHFLFDFASAMGGNDHSNFLNKIVSEKSVDISYLASLYSASAGTSSSAGSGGGGGSGRSGANCPPSMFSDLLLFGLPTVMAYTGWGSVKFDYSTLSCSFAPLPSLYCLFTMENSMEASVYLKAAEDEDAMKAKGGRDNHNNKKERRELLTPACVMAAGYVNGFLNECWQKYSHTAPVFSFLKGRGSGAYNNAAETWASGGDGDAGDSYSRSGKGSTIGHSRGRATRERSGSTASALSAPIIPVISATTLPDLAVVELSCRALGHDCCEFMVCVRSQVERCARTYLESRGRGGSAALAGVPLVDILATKDKADADASAKRKSDKTRK